MDYYGLLFLYYLKGLSGKSVLKLFFNIEAGGTEQLLPENTSTPTTTPILADIQYPDGLRTDQYFTYRETPTTVSNKARIKTIKGQTIKWNQLCNGIGTLTADGITTEYDSSTHKYKITNNSRTTNYASGSTRGTFAGCGSTQSGHKYLLLMTPQVTGVVFAELIPSIPLMNCGNKTIWTSSGGELVLRINNDYDFVNVHPIGDITEFYALVIDLTRMFGAGNEPATVEDFTCFFPLPFYDYNAGTLLSFNGTGIKTVGKNLLSYSGENLPYDAQGVSISRTDDIYKVVMNNATGYPFARICTIPYLKKGQYTVTMLGTGGSNGAIGWRLVDRNTSTPIVYRASEVSVTRMGIDQDLYNVYFELTVSSGTLSTGSFDVQFMLAFGMESEYEPYTSSLLNLPISTYFPTGMKEVNNGVYDELTETKAITRIGAVDMGTMVWRYDQSFTRFYSTTIGNLINKTGAFMDGLNCARYEPNASPISAQRVDKTIAKYNNGNIFVVDRSFTDATAFTNSVQGQYLYFELATYTETPITTEDANEALSLLMGKSVSSNNANQLINIITKGE